MRVLTTSDEEMIVKLDIKDKKILSLLCQNSRIPYSKIGKAIGLSRQSVEYRIEQMEKNHLIVGSRTVINLNALGYQTYHFLIEPSTTEQENEIIKRCEKAEFVNVIISYSGRYPLEISIIAKNPKDYDQKFNTLFHDMNVKSHDVFILLETIKGVVLPNNYLTQINQKVRSDNISFAQDFKNNKKYREIDETDIKILQIISDNANEPISKIANKLKLSSDSVIYRIKKMVTQHIIIQFRPAINYSALNLSIQTILLKTKTNQEGLKKLEMFLKEHNAVLWAAKTFGYWNYIMFIITSNQEEFHEFLNGLKNKHGSTIRFYESLYAYKEHKYSFFSNIINTER